MYNASTNEPWITIIKKFTNHWDETQHNDRRLYVTSHSKSRTVKLPATESELTTHKHIHIHTMSQLKGGQNSSPFINKKLNRNIDYTSSNISSLNTGIYLM